MSYGRPLKYCSVWAQYESKQVIVEREKVERRKERKKEKEEEKKLVLNLG